MTGPSEPTSEPTSGAELIGVPVGEWFTVDNVIGSVYVAVPTGDFVPDTITVPQEFLDMMFGQ